MPSTKYESSRRDRSRSRERYRKSSRYDDPEHPHIAKAIKNLRGIIERHPSRLSRHIGVIQNLVDVLAGREEDSRYYQSKVALKVAYVSIVKFVETAPEPNKARSLIGGLHNVVSELCSRRLKVDPVDSLHEVEELLKNLEPGFLDDVQKSKVAHTVELLPKFKAVGKEYEQSQKDLRCAALSLRKMKDEADPSKQNRLQAIANGLDKCMKNLTSANLEELPLVESMEEILALLKCLEPEFITKQYKGCFNHTVKSIELYLKREEENEQRKANRGYRRPRMWGHMRPVQFYGGFGAR